MSAARRQLRFWLILLAVTLGAVYLLRGVLLPFVAGAAVAYMLDPICDRLQRWGCTRALATTLVTLVFALVVVLALILLVPALYHQAVTFVERLPAIIDAVRDRVAPLVDDLRRLVSESQAARIERAAGDAAGRAVNWTLTAVGGVITGGLALVNLLSLVFITPVVTFYLLRDWDRIVYRIEGLLPRAHADTIREQARLADETLSGFVRGQATVCFLLGSFYAIALSLVGLDFGLVVGLVAGALSFVPYVGSIVGFVASMGLAIAQFSDWISIAIVAAIFFIGQAVEGNFLTPKLVGDRVRLHPVWIIFALLAGGALFGFVGVLLAVPVAAVVGVLIRFAIGRYTQSRYYADTEHAPIGFRQDAGEKDRG
jgi:predicted PurR-regulated permease PerM